MRGVTEKASVSFTDDDQAAVLLYVRLTRSFITGVRWAGQAEEATHTYPLHRVRCIEWMDDSEVPF